ncbi:MAG: purine permease [Synechococcales cyanobacterium M58_A2018_015]|nr:purine permease [Synechococcales cyanobacterium M58_A2018_015]
MHADSNAIQSNVPVDVQSEPAPPSQVAPLYPAPPTAGQSELTYGLEDRPPLAETLWIALQHVFAAFVGIITPPLVIATALGLDPASTSYLVSMSLFASGLCTFIQCRQVGPIGSGLLSLQGTSFAFLGPIIGVSTTAMQSGQSPQEALALVFGVCCFGSLTVMVLSSFLPVLQRVITPVVSGTVVLLIGLSLIKVGVVNLAGGMAAQHDGTFGSYSHLALGGGVLAVILLLNATGNRYLRMGAIVIGLLVGYGVAILLGKVDFSFLQQLPLVNLPLPLRYGMRFDFSAVVPFVLLYVIVTIESIGDLTATSVVSNQPISGAVYWRRIRGGILGDGINSLLAAILNTFPNTTFCQNNGVIQMTGVGSRYVGFYVAAILALLGLLPSVGGMVQAIPAPVLGGATLIMFGSIAVTGIHIVATAPLDRRALSIVALSLALGLGVAYAPEILEGKPSLIQQVFSSSVSTGGLTAMVLNLLLPRS